VAAELTVFAVEPALAPIRYPSSSPHVCVDHRVGIADDETYAFFTGLMDEAEAMLWGRVTYEMMEAYWPAVARGDQAAPPAVREWAVKLEAKRKYVVSSTRKDFPWSNSHHVTGDLRTSVQALKEATAVAMHYRRALITRQSWS
jgi:dihydrofolate reductase